MQKNELTSHALAEALRGRDLHAERDGDGTHWKVLVTQPDGRSARVHCFWYDLAVSGLILGMNPANSRSSVGAPSRPLEGAQYLVQLLLDEEQVGVGRTQSHEATIAAIEAWLRTGAIERVWEAAPFVDAKPRRLRAIASNFDASLRWDIGGDPGHPLRVYGRGRSCRLSLTDEGQLACRFFVKQASVALASLDDERAPEALAAWLLERPPVTELATRVDGVVLEPHAELLETEPTRWHWQHFRDRIQDEYDVLADLKPLVERLAESEVATRSYTYSSLNRLCFSASSHYPWVDHGLPVVSPGRDGEVWVERAPHDVDQAMAMLEAMSSAKAGAVCEDDLQELRQLLAVERARCDVDEACALIETMLSDYPVEPFFGSAPHYELPRLQRMLTERNCAAEAAVVQCGDWPRLEVAAGENRRCRVDGQRVTFFAGGVDGFATWPTIDDAVEAIARFLESEATVQEMLDDPRALHASKVTPTRPGF